MRFNLYPIRSYRDQRGSVCRQAAAFGDRIETQEGEAEPVARGAHLAGILAV